MTEPDLKEQFLEYTNDLQQTLTAALSSGLNLAIDTQLIEDPSGQTRIILDSEHWTLVVDHLLQFEHSELLSTMGATGSGMSLLPDTTLKSWEYIRVWLPFRNLSRFEFIIRHEHWDDKLMKYLGRQDIQAHSEIFNNRFLCQSNDPEIFEHMIEAGPVGDMLLRQPEVQFMTDFDSQWITGPEEKNTSFFQFLSTAPAVLLVVEQCILTLQAYRLFCEQEPRAVGKPDIEIVTG